MTPGRRAAGSPRLYRLFVYFAASGFVAVLVVALGAGLVLRDVGQRESVRDARHLTELLARSVIEPGLTEGVVRGDPQALGRFDRLVRARAISGSVVRIKLWAPDGRIVYSDRRQLIGARYRLGGEELAVLRGGGVDAGISDLTRPENRFERSEHKLLEVYLPVRTQRGTPLLFESYLRFSDVAASGRRVWLTIVPALIAALLLLWLVQLPLALNLARRLRRGHMERETLLLRALNASDVERRRIAGDLHDGVVQSLAGTAYALSVAADRATAAPSAELGGVLTTAAGSLRQAVRQLRSLLVEIYPPNLETAGLPAAIDDLLAGVTARGVAAVADVRPLRISSESERLVFRTVQEAVRNVIDHAAAASCRVTLEAAEGGVELIVEDDGRGFDPGIVAAHKAEGHLGLTLLADRAEQAGGTLELASSPGRGTRLRLWLPTA